MKLEGRKVNVDQLEQGRRDKSERAQRLTNGEKRKKRERKGRVQARRRGE